MKATTNAKCLIVISDLHCGCRLGLCPLEGAKLDDGGLYRPSKFQKQILWRWWKEFWDEWVPMVTRGQKWDLVVNGDALDGVHHNGTTQISQNLEDQTRIAEAVLGPVVMQARKYYHIRGTEAHVGPSGREEERLAKILGAVPNDEGQYARWDLWKRVGNKRGPLCHILHHIGTTGRAAYESSAPQAELIAEFVEAGQERIEPPAYAIRSHRHRYIKPENPGRFGETATIITPGWQGKVPFVWKIPGGRTSNPQFGGIAVIQGDEEYYSRAFVKKMKRGKVENT